MNTNPVVWFEIYVQDMARAKAFYEKMLGIALDKMDAPDNPEMVGMEMWTFPGSMDKGGALGALVKMSNGPSGGGGTLIYFSCADCAHEEKRAQENGGRVQQPKMSIGQHGFISLIVDTEGNMIGLHSMS